jgi:hypothetical protein
MTDSGDPIPANPAMPKAGVFQSAWWILFTVSVVLAAAHYWLIGWVQLYLPASSWQPAGLKYALEIRNYLPLLPIIVVTAALLALRLPASERAAAPAMTGIVLGLLSLGHCSWILVPAVKHAAWGVPHRLPDAYRNVVLAPDSMEILWLNTDLEPGKEASPEHFRKYRIRGRATVPDAATREKLGLTVIKSMEDYPYGTAKKGGVEIHLVICYECSSMHAFKGEQKAFAVIGRSSLKDMDEFLISAGIPIPPPPKR